MVWSQLEVDKAHVAYAILGVSTTVFAVFSLFLKERLFIGEATASTLVGIVTGPKVLNWFNPLSWGNTDYITQEVSRIVLIIQIFAVSVELPKKYMKHHGMSVLICLFFGMIFGWFVTASFIYLLFPRINFAGALLISGCVTATDPVLAAAIVGKGKFGQRVPGHLKNLISAESGANDGMAFPFVLLASELVLHYGHTGEILKDWFCVAVLYEIGFGTFLGIVIGYCGRQMIKFAERKNLIDKESFFVFYILLSLICTGFGSMLGADDLIVSFAAGAAFAWDGWFAEKTEETNLSNIIDLLLNMGYFTYLGAIFPWSDYNNLTLGLNYWRYILLGLTAIFLRRIPIFLLIKPFTKDIRSWKEAVFIGHFGPIGVGGVFCSMIATATIQKEIGIEDYPISDQDINTPHHYLLRVLWPIVTFLVLTSIIIHGSSVTIMTLTSNVKQMKFEVRRPRLSRRSSKNNSALPSRSSSFTDLKNEARSSSSRLRLSRHASATTVHNLSFIKVRDDDERSMVEDKYQRMAPIPLRYDDDGVLRKPEIAYLQGNAAIVEDCNGEVIDEFQIFSGLDDEDLDDSLWSKFKRFIKLEDSNPAYNVNIDEKNSRKSKLKRLGKQVLTAYQISNDVIIENEDGEVIRRYVITGGTNGFASGTSSRGDSPNQEALNADLEANPQDPRSILSNSPGMDISYDEGEIRENLNQLINNREIKFSDDVVR